MVRKSSKNQRSTKVLRRNFFQAQFTEGESIKRSLRNNKVSGLVQAVSRVAMIAGTTMGIFFMLLNAGIAFSYKTESRLRRTGMRKVGKWNG